MYVCVCVCLCVCVKSLTEAEVCAFEFHDVMAAILLNKRDFILCMHVFVFRAVWQTYWAEFNNTFSR